MNRANVQSILDRAHHFAEQGDLQQVEQTLSSGLTDHPESTELMGHLGYFYFQQKRYRKAATLFQSMLDAGRQDEGAQKLLDEIHQKIQPIITQQLSSNSSAHKTYYAFMVPFVSVLLKLSEMFSRETIFSLSHFVHSLQNASAKTQQACLAYHKAREIIIASNAMPYHQSGARVLDLGAGNNLMPVYWSRFGAQVVALDGSLYGFPSLRDVQQRAGGNAQFVCGDVTRLPLVDHSFDGVSALCMIEHLPYEMDKSAMREIYRVLKPGGVAAITVEGNSEHFEEWIELPYEVGFQIGNKNQTIEELFCRNYSEETLAQRLIQLENWEVLSSGFYDDCCIPFRKYFNQFHPSFIRSALRPFQPMLSLIFYQLAQDADMISPSSIGFAVLRKPL